MRTLVKPHFMHAVLMVILALACLTLTDCSGPKIDESAGPGSAKDTGASSSELTFKTILHARAVDERVFTSPQQASDLVVHTALYEASDGVKVQRNIYNFRTAAQARRKLRRLLAEAETVVEHDKSDRRAGRTEERAVLLRKATDPSWKAAVIWTSGADMYALESSSLEHVLLLEKRLKPPPAAAVPR
jgi:hypothetical protein